jgi:flagellar hook-length control protein FliK
MIRRLHLQEVHPPANAVTPVGKAADNETQDGTDSSSLALEFEQLLAKLADRTAALTDGASALGLALAQTGPAARTVSHDQKKDLKTADFRDDREVEVRSDENAGDHNSGFEVQDSDTEKSDDTASSDEQDSQDEVSQVEADTTQVGPEVEQVALIASAVVQVEAVRKVVVADTHTDDTETDTIDDHGPAQNEDLVADQGPKKGETDASQVVEIATTQNQTHVVQEAQTRIRVQEHKKDKDADDAFVTASTTPLATDPADSNDIRRIRLEDHRRDNNQPESGTQSNQQPLNVPVNVATSTESSRADSKLSDEARALLNDMMQSRGGEGAQKVGSKAKEEGDFSAPEAAPAPVAKTTTRASHGDIQMALLRQAFESLKQARQESGDSRQRAVTPATNGVGAASEPRRAEGDSSSRGSRPMTRPQTDRMMERVEVALKEAAKSRDGKTISLRLDPAEFGRVKVDVSLRDGALHARLTPENQQVMTALQENAHELHSALRKLGLDVSSVSVTVTPEKAQDDHGMGGQMQNGSSFHDERNNMPHNQGQLAENTFGNELAQGDWKTVVTPEKKTAVVDHWVA